MTYDETWFVVKIFLYICMLNTPTCTSTCEKEKAVWCSGRASTCEKDKALAGTNRRYMIDKLKRVAYVDG